MMNHHENGSKFSQKILSRQQLIISSLVKSATEMLHIDVLFLWLSHAIVQQYNVQAAQIWVSQATQSGQISTQLRAWAYEDDSLPQYVTLNNQVTAWVDNLLLQQRLNSFDNISQVFPTHEAVLFNRYGLHFCSSYYLSSSALLPPKKADLSDEILLTPLEVAFVLFLQQPLVPEQRVSIQQIIKQAIKIAEEHGLLLPASEAPGQLTGNHLNPSGQEDLQVLAKIVPHAIEDVDLMKSSNPLTGAVVIADKQARRLFSAIDGRRNLTELCSISHLDMKEVTIALRLLLSQKRVQLYNAEERLEDIPLFLTHGSLIF